MSVFKQADNKNKMGITAKDLSCRSVTGKDQEDNICTGISRQISAVRQLFTQLRSPAGTLQAVLHQAECSANVCQIDNELLTFSVFGRVDDSLKETVPSILQQQLYNAANIGKGNNALQAAIQSVHNKQPSVVAQHTPQTSSTAIQQNAKAILQPVQADKKSPSQDYSYFIASTKSQTPAYTTPLQLPEELLPEELRKSVAQQPHNLPDGLTRFSSAIDANAVPVGEGSVNTSKGPGSKAQTQQQSVADSTAGTSISTTTMSTTTVTTQPVQLIDTLVDDILKVQRHKKNIDRIAPSDYQQSDNERKPLLPDKAQTATNKAETQANERNVDRSTNDKKQQSMDVMPQQQRTGYSVEKTLSSAMQLIEKLCGDITSVSKASGNGLPARHATQTDSAAEPMSQIAAVTQPLPGKGGLAVNKTAEVSALPALNTGHLSTIAEKSAPVNAQQLATVMNDILVEQAMRQGVDLSNEY